MYAPTIFVHFVAFFVLKAVCQSKHDSYASVNTEFNRKSITEVRNKTNTGSVGRLTRLLYLTRWEWEWTNKMSSVFLSGLFNLWLRIDLLTWHSMQENVPGAIEFVDFVPRLLRYSCIRKWSAHRLDTSGYFNKTDLRISNYSLDADIIVNFISLHVSVGRWLYVLSQSLY